MYLSVLKLSYLSVTVVNFINLCGVCVLCVINRVGICDSRNVVVICVYAC